MIINNCEQGTEEWLQARLAIPTSSNFSKIVSPTGKLSTSSLGYQDQLMAEFISGVSTDSYISPDMELGTEREPDARLMYEVITGNKVDLVGLVYKDDTKTVSCSPDGLIGLEKGVEIKCPKLTTQIKRVREGILPNEYIPQVQGSMWITGFKEWDFFSYHPQYKPFLMTVKRDDKYIEVLSDSVKKFSETLEALKSDYEKIRSEFGNAE